MNGEEARRAASTALLVAGYPLSIAGGTHLLRTMRERRSGKFHTMQAGIAAVTAGLVLRRRWLSAAANGVTLVGLEAAWAVSGRWLK